MPALSCTVDGNIISVEAASVESYKCVGIWTTLLLCFCCMCITSLHLKCTWTLFMWDFMERNPKTSKASTRHGSGLSVWRITPLIMCGATGMTHIQIMLKGCLYPQFATRCRTSTGDVVCSPCSREDMETEAIFFFLSHHRALSYSFGAAVDSILLYMTLYDGWGHGRLVCSDVTNVAVRECQGSCSFSQIIHSASLSSYHYDGKAPLVIDILLIKGVCLNIDAVFSAWATICHRLGTLAFSGFARNSLSNLYILWLTEHPCAAVPCFMATQSHIALYKISQNMSIWVFKRGEETVWESNIS